MRKKILFVDDDPISHFIHTKILKHLSIDCEIRIALNGKEALDTMIADQPDRFVPDFLFVDINMPVMDGFRFIQSFHTMQIPGKENTLIIILTSSNNVDDRSRAVDLGIENYIVKPLGTIDLSRILHRND
jgi:CheY-like chemotaxis protein